MLYACIQDTLSSHTCLAQPLVFRTSVRASKGILHTSFMHFNPRLNSKSILTCATIRPHGSKFTLNLGDKKVYLLMMN